MSSKDNPTPQTGAADKGWPTQADLTEQMAAGVRRGLPWDWSFLMYCLGYLLHTPVKCTALFLF